MTTLSFDKIEELQKIGCLSAEDFETFRVTIDTTFDDIRLAAYALRSKGKTDSEMKIFKERSAVLISDLNKKSEELRLQTENIVSFLIKCDCGHHVESHHHKMQASLGSSCPDCFDRMSGC